MRVLIAPDKFAGTLTAVEAATAIAEGWRRHAPDDILDLAPMADGGPGFVDVLHSSLGGELALYTVTGPLGDPVPATILFSGDTAYLEAAQACGLHLVKGSNVVQGSSATARFPDKEEVADRRDPERATSYGVGELIVHAITGGARRVVVGLGGSATNDGGAGLLAALGASADRPLSQGPVALTGISEVQLPELDPSIQIIVASDVDNPLLGMFGATKVYGPQKGLPEERLPVVDGWLTEFADVVGKRIALMPGAGAAGGIGFALLALGAQRESGIELVAAALSLTERAAMADLVITGEGAFDFSSRAGKVPYGVAAIAGAAVRPCIALAGQVHVGAREMRALGIESAYALIELIGEEAAFARPAGALSDLAERVARTWSRE